MSIKNFKATPTPSEPISLDEISRENMKDAWKDYEAKPEYKNFNKHDMIESMQSSKQDDSTSTAAIKNAHMM